MTKLMLLLSSETSVEDLADALTSSASAQQKTNFIIQYLLSQRTNLMNLLRTVIILIIVYFVGKKLVQFCLGITKKYMERRNVEISMQKFIMSLAKVCYNMVLIFVLAWIIGVGATVIAVVGSAGLALGLALQGSLSNLAGGVLILTLKPFKVGDTITVTTAEGIVEDIDIFYTHLVTKDNKQVVIPNGTITNSIVTNASQQNIEEK